MHWSILLLPLVLATLPICHSVQSHSPLEHRDSLQNLTNVTCQPSFDWARNSAQQSPCIVAVATYYACSGPLEEIPSLSPGYHYDTPGETTGPGTANGPLDQCTCSWVAYNLFSVCTACQGDNDSIITWDTYTINCTGLTEDSTYYPSNVIPEDNTSIPYYATINPSQWKNAVFDIDQAKNISSQGLPDITFGAALAPSKNKNVAAIAGGSAGGGIVLSLIGAGIVSCIYRKRKRRNHDYSKSSSPTMQFSMTLPNTSMDIEPFTLPPPLVTARVKSHASADRDAIPDAAIESSTLPPLLVAARMKRLATHTSADRDTIHGSTMSIRPLSQGETQAGPPAYSELFESPGAIAYPVAGQVEGHHVRKIHQT